LRARKGCQNISSFQDVTATETPCVTSISQRIECEDSSSSHSPFPLSRFCLTLSYQLSSSQSDLVVTFQIRSDCTNSLPFNPLYLIAIGGGLLIIIAVIVGVLCGVAKIRNRVFPHRERAEQRRNAVKLKKLQNGGA